MIDIEYIVIRRSRRRTASLQVSPDNKVSIIVPDNLTPQKIAEIVERKRGWVISKIQSNEAVQYPARPKEFVSGESFTYLGRNYRLKLVQGKPMPVEFKNGRFYVKVDKRSNSIEDDVRATLTSWYKKHAISKFKQRTALYADRVGVDYRTIGIKDYKSQWGSCTKVGDLHFNWRVIIAPISIVDYVVVHELCHRRHHDHSPAFWKLLGRILPDYRDRKEWLRVNGPELVI